MSFVWMKAPRQFPQEQMHLHPGDSSSAMEESPQKPVQAKVYEPLGVFHANPPQRACPTAAHSYTKAHQILTQKRKYLCCGVHSARSPVMRLSFTISWQTA